MNQDAEDMLSDQACISSTYGQSSMNPRNEARLSILIHSIPVFIEFGVEKTTVQDLLEASSVSRRTFYKYFKNKIDVLDAVYVLNINLLVNRFKSIQSQSTTLSDLGHLCIDEYLDYCISTGPIILLTIEQAMCSDSLLFKAREDAHHRIIGMMHEELARLGILLKNDWPTYAFLTAIEGLSLRVLRLKSELDCVVVCKKTLHTLFMSMFDKTDLA